MRYKMVELMERANVQQARYALTRGHFAARMLLVDSLLSAALLGLFTKLVQAVELSIFPVIYSHGVKSYQMNLSCTIPITIA